LNTLPFGIGVAASTRVGNFIGSRSPSGAKAAAHASALLSVIVGMVVMVAMMASKDASSLFTTAPWCLLTFHSRFLVSCSAMTEMLCCSSVK
jgi:Na+-driven multidrug efflux pump